MTTACSKEISELRHEVDNLHEKVGSINFAFVTDKEALEVSDGYRVDLKFDDTFTRDNYSSLIAEVAGEYGIASSVATKSVAGTPWEIHIGEPEFDEAGKLSNVPYVLFRTTPQTGDNAVLTVTAVDGKGRRSSRSITVYAQDKTPDYTSLTIVLDILKDYGAYLPELDPDEHHLFIGIDDSGSLSRNQAIEASHDIFLCLNPLGEMAEVETDGDDVTIELLDEDNKTLLGKLVFTAGQGSGVDGVIGTMQVVLPDGTPCNGADAVTYFFIRDSYIPESEAQKQSPYKLGEVYKYRSDVPTGFDSGNLDYVCIRECSTGLCGILLHLSKETLLSRGWNKTKSETVNFIRGSRAVEIANLMRKDFPKYQKMFENLEYCHPLDATTTYWTQEYKFIFFCTKHWAVNFGTGKYDWYDVQNKNYTYNKSSLYSFDFEGRIDGECRNDYN